MPRHTALRALVLLPALLVSITSACELLLPAPAEEPPPRGRRGGDDECSRNSDCAGGERCDDGECVDIEAGEGEGEGEGEPPPPPPPACGEVGCPEIISFSSNRSTLSERDTATLSAVVTDPDGVSDLIGGVLLDPSTNTVYGTFTATGAGTFSIDVSWNTLNPVRAIEFSSSTTRVLRGRFFDQGGLEALGDVTLTLRCNTAGDAACDGQCAFERCNGSCQRTSSFTDANNCGGCGVRCSSGICQPDNNDVFSCLGGGGEGEGEGEGEPGVEYTGTRENGVVCGVAGTCAEDCCLDPFTTTSVCAAAGQCLFLAGSCDGPEDCAGNEECCFGSFSTSCVAAGQCRSTGNEVCVTRADCAAGELCCASPTALAFGFDAGICQQAVDGACP